MSFELNQSAGIFETVKVAQVPSSTLFLPFFDTFYIDLKIFYIPFAIFVVVSMSNAVNLTDGLDGLAIGLLIIMFVPIVYGVFLPHDYIASMKYIPSLLSGTIFLCLSQYLGNMLLSNRKNKIVGISTTISAIFNILINLLLIKQIGLFAASFSTMISYIILYTIRYFNQRKSIVKKDILF